MKFQLLQALRAVAAMAVVVFHAQGMAPKYTGGSSVSGEMLGHLGGYGVDLFFVISGFIIRFAEPDHGYEPRHFAIRRVQRIVPIYWLLTALMIGFWVGLPNLYSSGAPDFARVLQSFLFSSLPTTGDMPIIYVGWSVEYEMLFYLAVFILLLGGRSPWAPIVTLFSWLVIFGRLLEINNSSEIQAPLLRFLTSSLLLEFSLGVCLGSWLKGHKLEFLSVISILIAFIFVGWSEFDRRALFVGLPSAIIVLVAMKFESRRHVHLWRPIIRAGDASYSIYLFQVFALSGSAKLVTTISKEVSPDVFVLVTSIASVAMGYLFYVYVERPTSDFLKGFPRSAVSIN